MKTRFLRFAGVRSGARRVSTVGLFLTLFATHGQVAAEQRRACKPEGDRACAPATLTVPSPQGCAKIDLG